MVLITVSLFFMCCRFQTMTNRIQKDPTFFQWTILLFVFLTLKSNTILWALLSHFKIEIQVLNCFPMFLLFLPQTETFCVNTIIYCSSKQNHEKSTLRPPDCNIILIIRKPLMTKRLCWGYSIFWSVLKHWKEQIGCFFNLFTKAIFFLSRSEINAVVLHKLSKHCTKARNVIQRVWLLSDSALHQKIQSNFCNFASYPLENHQEVQLLEQDGLFDVVMLWDLAESFHDLRYHLPLWNQDLNEVQKGIRQ